MFLNILTISVTANILKHFNHFGFQVIFPFVHTPFLKIEH